MESTDVRVCEQCGITVYRGRTEGRNQFASKRFCSGACAKANVKDSLVGYQRFPDRFCEVCGAKLIRVRRPSGTLESPGEYARRRFCSLACFGKRPKKAQPIVKWAAAHKRARQVLGSGPCEMCGRARAETHHRNEDINDNRMENLQRLCRSCHTKTHRGSPKCAVVICTNNVSSASGGGGNGYCSKHFQRWKKWGDPMLVKRNQHMPVKRADD